MGSSEEEEVMEERKKEVKASPLALPRPSYSSIASKEVNKPANDEEQNPAESVIDVPEQHKTLIVGDEYEIIEQEVDEEGFTPVLSKSGRRSRKSSRLSLSDKNESKQAVNILDSKSVDSNRNEMLKETNQSKLSISDDWMIDDVGTIETSHDEEIPTKTDFKEAEFKDVKSINEIEQETKKPSISEDWMIDDVGTIESSDEENRTPHNESRLSAIGQAQQFSCDDDQLEILDLEVTIEDTAEQTSWAYVMTGNPSDNQTHSTDVSKNVEDCFNLNREQQDEEKLKEREAFKDQHVESDNDLASSEGYMIDVKVTTKETCIGRKLHSQDFQEWKMDVQVVQHDSCPDIIEKSVNTGKVEENILQSHPKQLSLAPAWMRRGVMENENKTKPGFFPVVKSNQESMVKNTTADKDESKQEQQGEEEIYWRIKHKVKNPG